MNCGCASRKDVMTAGNWKTDAAVVSALGVMLIIARGGNMSTQTKKLLTIGFIGAIGAVFIDGMVKPNMKYS